MQLYIHLLSVSNPGSGVITNTSQAQKPRAQKRMYLLQPAAVSHKVSEVRETRPILHQENENTSTKFVPNPLGPPLVTQHL